MEREKGGAIDPVYRVSRSTDGEYDDDLERALGILDWNGVEIAVEFLPGDTRHGVVMDGTGYGRVIGTTGEDGEPIDCYLNGCLFEGYGYDRPVYRVTQLNDDGYLDEYKYMLGWEDAAAAERAYLSVKPSRIYGGIEGVDTSPRLDRDDDADDGDLEGRTAGLAADSMAGTLEQWTRAAADWFSKKDGVETARENAGELLEILDGKDLERTIAGGMELSDYRGVAGVAENVRGEV